MTPLKPTYPTDLKPSPTTSLKTTSSSELASGSATSSKHSTAIQQGLTSTSDIEKGVYIKGSRSRAIRHRRGVLSEGDTSRMCYDHGDEDTDVHVLGKRESQPLSHQELLLKHGVGVRRAWPAIEFR
jgi:hypothetical protein